MLSPSLLEQLLLILSVNATWLFFLAFRYSREVISLFAFVLHTNIPVPEQPTLTSQDVTVVLPSLDGDGEGLRETIRSILATEPHEIILVTIQANEDRACKMAASLPLNKLRILTVSQANKRRQMVRAMPEVMTKITIFADDDVRWPKTLLPHMLAPLEDESYGGVGTNQRVDRRANRTFTQEAWAFLGSAYLMRRNFDCASCNHIDGGLPCLSGRTVAYRTSIIKEDQFMTDFTNETWGLFNRDDYKLNTDDDNFLTRWLVKKGWKIKFQHHPEAEVLTDLEENANYLKQCLRWSRSNWRSNLTSMFIEGHVWFSQPWSSYSVFQTTLTHYSIIWDVLLFMNRPQALWADILLASLWIVAKTGKLMPHFIRWPSDLLWLPLSIVFGWAHMLIKMHAAVTLWETTWGSREGADANDTERMVHIPRTPLKQSPIFVHASNPFFDYASPPGEPRGAMPLSDKVGFYAVAAGEPRKSHLFSEKFGLVKPTAAHAQLPCGVFPQLTKSAPLLPLHNPRNLSSTLVVIT